MPRDAAPRPADRRGDPFSALGLEPSFDLDPRDIRRKQAALLRETHPDVAESAPGEAAGAGDADAALDRAAGINAAAGTLLDEGARADALLALRDPLGRDPPRPQAALVRALEFRQALEEAAPPERDRLLAEAREERQRAIALFASCWEADPAAARLARVEWRSWDRLIECRAMGGG